MRKLRIRKTNTRRHIAMVTMAIVVAAACGDRRSVDESVPPAAGTLNAVGNGGSRDPLEGTEWMTTSINGEEVLPQFPVTLRFNLGQVDGSAGCNLYAGTFDVDGNEITIAVGPTTRRACEEQQGTQENRFLDALAEAAQFEITDDALTLRDAAGDPLASFKSG